MADTDCVTYASCGLPGESHGVVKPLQYCRCFAQKDLSGRRQRQTSRISFEKRYAQLGLKITDLSAERWLRYMKFPGCSTDASQFGHRNEVSQMPQIDVWNRHLHPPLCTNRAPSETEDLLLP